jgi:hypothetical protein
MTKTSLDLARDRLAVARVCLQESVPATTPFINRLLTVDQQLGEGEEQHAGADIRTIITELGSLKSPRHTSAGSAKIPVQDPSEELLRGVAAAIVQLSKAVDLLL